MKVRMSLAKCDLASRKVNCCGRRLANSKWTFLPEYYEKILRTSKPIFEHQMAEVIYLATWLAPSIPRLAELKGIEISGSKKALKVKNEPVEWTPKRTKAWDDFLLMISRAAKEALAVYDPNEALCILTDVSIKYWSGIVTQCKYEELGKKEVEKQIHKPIMFFSGKFEGSPCKWHISSKELYPLIHVCKRLDYLILGHPRPVVLFTDHRNLVHVLEPGSMVNKSHAERLYRWGMKLQGYNVEAVHVEG
eukprot:snap_masked-scaffold_2-processed-gene-22.28-mRNA-1 protein AED:0.27 eAED:0.27 QI:0/0/0/0.5/1/1/2/0/248